MNHTGIDGWPPASGRVAGREQLELRETSLLDRIRAMSQICRQTFGISDYERYLAHAAALHPDAPVVSRRDFCAQAIERKYGRSGPRCC